MDLSAVPKETYEQRFQRLWAAGSPISLAQRKAREEMLEEIHAMLFALCQDRGLIETPDAAVPGPV